MRIELCSFLFVAPFALFLFAIFIPSKIFEGFLQSMESFSGIIKPSCGSSLTFKPSFLLNKHFIFSLYISIYDKDNFYFVPLLVNSLSISKIWKKALGIFPYNSLFLSSYKLSRTDSCPSIEYVFPEPLWP